MFDDILLSLCDPIKSILYRLHEDIKSQVQEIRLRIGSPLSIVTANKIYFICKNSDVVETMDPFVYTVTAFDLKNCFRSLCSYSIHSYQDEIRNGFITIKGGHRVGICGTAVKTSSNITTIKDISSLNIRIACQRKGVAQNLINQLFAEDVYGILIAGPPSSGKTTLLKDIARILSSGHNGRYFKISVIDERGEIGAINKGIANNDLGLNCDIFDGFSKYDGMTMAIRSMSPDIIICDEIGTQSDAIGVQQSLNAGVHVIATVHAKSEDDIINRRHIYELVCSHAFKSIVFLEDNANPCSIKNVVKIGDLIGKNIGYSDDNGIVVYDRNL